MHWLLLGGFIAAHVLAYIAVFRYLRVFAAERTIVIYHGLAFAAVFAAVALAFARGTIGFAAACGLLALQYACCSAVRPMPMSATASSSQSRPSATLRRAKISARSAER